ncbi:hypothetical protein M430DRAFT_152033 [Amorphotheca resinae ATCC 22711]|jgi:hypothetical protein|uniref:Uncharacterized protein n=1 Tax=Amorphotheca resinae ATCC 22711 TaxID=857342 RepID=A0A2T3BD51_AMORE|nr:hypothetical protein M430DRAFT_152033 [Amorphotheca resinae ATCC 22711]PSS27263.1 hypothetical protein M430DRAFT_152033 [Amorphotheca resinae ATCC 22711]
MPSSQQQKHGQLALHRSVSNPRITASTEERFSLFPTSHRLRWAGAKSPAGRGQGQAKNRIFTGQKAVSPRIKSAFIRAAVPLTLGPPDSRLPTAERARLGAGT